KIFLSRRARDPAAPARRFAAHRTWRLMRSRPAGARQDHAGGVFLEELERNPAKYLPEIDAAKLGGEVVHVDLRRPMKEILARLSKYPIKPRLSLTGPMVVARDLAHGKLRERLERGEGLPDYFKNHPVYYAGPAKTPQGYASGAFGPTTAGRMD